MNSEFSEFMEVSKSPGATALHAPSPTHHRRRIPPAPSDRVGGGWCPTPAPPVTVSHGYQPAAMLGPLPPQAPSCAPPPQNASVRAPRFNAHEKMIQLFDPTPTDFGCLATPSKTLKVFFLF